MGYSAQEKAKFVGVFIEEAYCYVKFVKRIRRDAGDDDARNPDRKTIQKWVENFYATGSVHGERGMHKSK